MEQNLKFKYNMLIYYILHALFYIIILEPEIYKFFQLVHNIIYHPAFFFVQRPNVIKQ